MFRSFMRQTMTRNVLNKLSMGFFSKKLPDKWILGPQLAEKEKKRTYTFKIFPNDEVIVTDGKFKGKVGKVIRVYRKEKKILVSGINLMEIDVESDIMAEEHEQKVFVEKPIWYHHVALFDKDTGKRLKVRMAKDENGQTIRKTIKTKIALPIPQREENSYVNRHKGKAVGQKDTEVNLVLEKTFIEYNFEEIARQFVEKIKEKEKIEKFLILKDK